MAYLGRFNGSQATHASPAMAAASKDAAAATATDPSALPTSTKWSVLSSRVEGLVAELQEVVGKQDAYCVSVSRVEGGVMAAVREKMLATPWGDLWENKQTMFSYGEEMSTDPLEAMLLKQLVFMAAPRRVLEIGMFVGYGSVAMLEGSPEANVVSLEIDPYLKGWLASCLERFPKVAARHEVVVGPALASLPKLEGQFDMVFVDANKAEYKRYLELILEHKLLSSRGVIVCDNVLYNGYPYAHHHFDAQPARRHFGDAIREFNQWVADHPKLEQVVLPVRDGISIIKLRSDDDVTSTFALAPRPTVAETLAVTVVCCGAPKRGMGWYHCKQVLDGRVPGASLANVVEPWFLGNGKETPLAKDFTEWAAKNPSVNFQKSLSDLPAPSGAQLVMICGRTADNPKLFREAVDRGFSHVYLEKPGAPSVAELEAMESYAKAHGVAVFMGFNRNFSKYVRQAHEFMTKEGIAKTSMTLTRKDCFNTQESLDECFERNAEGMIKNMMCHELMVLITYYGLTADNIKKVVADQGYTKSEMRRGHKDFSRMKFTLTLSSGQEFVVAGDRQGGEHAEAIVHVDGKAVLTAVRPDKEILATSEKLEAEMPGCMPYFYLQDAEYIALKQQVVAHVAQHAEGRPEGVAGIREAIECLKVCDKITESLVQAMEHPKIEKSLEVAQQGHSGPALSRPNFDLKEGHYIVTGGTQGLGLEIARQLKAVGAARIALLSRSKAKGDAAVAELTGSGCTAVFVEADMSSPESLQAAAAAAIEAMNGRVDGLVNAAGTTERGNLMGTTVEMFDKQFDINTRGPFFLTQAVARHFIDKKVRGSIVNISSIAAKGGAPFITAYSASKAALNVLTAVNAAELAPHGIRVNAINMGWTYTDNENALMVKKGGPDWLEKADAGLPLKRLMRPIDVACTVLFLLSPASMMTTGNCYDLHPDNALGLLSLKTEDSLDR
jgi:NAD(P)-dependent dehydrogenase (short-subunit alcohol dehydrogenase family)/predicted O-methyltransferase YrrM/predicted dehydrogenase